MNDARHHTIWSPETGITDLQADPHLLSASDIPGIRAVWTDQRQRLRGTAQLSVFTEQLSREWAIETGIIENLYDIERGVTQTLIEHGFQAELLGHGFHQSTGPTTSFGFCGTRRRRWMACSPS